MSMYYLQIRNAIYGPYTEEQVQAMVAEHKVQVTDLAFEQGGSQQWLPLQGIPKLMKSPGKQARKLAIDPTQSSTPINQPDVERTLWTGSPSMWTSAGMIASNVFVVLLSFLIYSIVALDLLPPSITVFHSYPEIKLYLLYIVVAISVFACLRTLWKIIVVKSIAWELTSERFIYKIGIFSQRVENMELYRIKDVTLRKPFLLRLIKHGYVDMISGDKSDSEIKGIGAIRNPENLYELLRKGTERQRQLRGVRAIEPF